MRRPGFRPVAPPPEYPSYPRGVDVGSRESEVVRIDTVSLFKVSIPVGVTMGLLLGIGLAVFYSLNIEALMISIVPEDKWYLISGLPAKIVLFCLVGSIVYSIIFSVALSFVYNVVAERSGGVIVETVE
ncbi:MAG: hypothetical protein DRO11_00570 [Methanobacteriota archaeon]|nr:MAG: hypothetical protein DRO11_00570 [Euryarchaeota archaeon]